MLRTLIVLLLPLGSLAVTVRSSQTKSVPDFLSPEAKNKRHYYKQSGVGETSLYTATANLGAGPSWTWHHPRGRAYSMTYGITIDDEANLYLTAVDGVRKFTPDGQQVWEHITRPSWMYNTASLADGKVYGQDLEGHVFALDMATGNTVWKTKLCDRMGQNNGFTNVDNGIVVVDSHAIPGPNGVASHSVSGVNATDGSVLWTYRTGEPVWNFGASFPGDGSVTFQDLTGVAYRLRASDGKELWKSKHHPLYTFTDGTATIDSAGNMYTVENIVEIRENYPGKLTKRSISDGNIVWQVITPHPPNNQPVIGHGLVIQPMGSQQQQGAYSHIYAYDQITGEVKWVFHAPPQKGRLQAGDEELQDQRSQDGIPGWCWPNPWSAPSFGQDGTVYIGNQEGEFYSLRDADGDGVISGPQEMSVYGTSSAFSGSSSPAIAPGVLAIANCDTMYVFRY